MTKDVCVKTILEEFGVVGEGVEVGAIQECFGGDEEGGFDEEFGKHCRVLLSFWGGYSYL
jgi:hypothetical protein